MNAKVYSEVNDVQLQYGKNLALTAAIKHGDKVLDMGCGTGELTSFLAEKVGKDGQVIGVDPDQHRIKVAIHNHSSIDETSQFVQGESSSHFPHNEEQYYDVHFSNFVFQWLNPDEKKIFVETAFRCLKPGGIIAIQSLEEDPNVVTEAIKFFQTAEVPVFYVKKSVIVQLLEKEGFDIVFSEYYERPYIFPSAQQFLSCFCASDYYEESSISPMKKAELFNKITNSDGTVTCLAPTVFQVIAKKPDMHLE